MSTSRRRALVLAAALTLTTVLTACEQTSEEKSDIPATITLPPLSGRYPVGTTDLHLVDSRPDPWQPADKRELMVTVTYPAQGRGDRAPWMSPGVAKVIDETAADPDVVGLPKGTVDWGRTTRQALTSAEVDRTQGSWPVLLFSHGGGSLREINSVLTDDLASHGYVVVSISHPHDAGAVEFPGGRIVRAGDARHPEFRTTSIDARVADSKFVLDELTRLDKGDNPDAENRTLPTGLVGALDLSKVGMLGHSFGGYTTGETMVGDQRIAAGINLDGGMGVGKTGEIVRQGVNRPFMLVGADGVDPTTGREFRHSHAETDIDPSWQEFWPNQRAWKRDLHFDAAAHNSFTDLQVAIPQLSRILPLEVQRRTVGTIDPGRSLAAQHAYLTAFFDLHLKDIATPLFDGPNPAYPDTRFID